MWLNKSYNKKEFENFLVDFLPEDLDLFEKELVITENYKEIKSGVILGECPSLDLSILQLDHEKERDPRIALANEAFKIMSENWAKKALVVFRSKNSDNWRLSFMTVSFDINEKNKVITNLSNPKRKSFFLGHDAKIATPERFLIKKGRVKNIEDLESCFDVEVVTKEFFDNYRKLFDKLNKYLKEDKAFNVFAGNKQIKVDDFAKKLLGQIVFIYFLQKKGWLGAKKEDHIHEGDSNFLRNLYSRCEKKKENFFNSTLEYLFYNAFNKEPEKAGSFYREYFDCQIPFLNGGLFEPLNKYDWEREFLCIPNELFSNDEKTGILDIFDLYNFTIDENSPIDQEVSVDPEMLGKVFEKLLDTNKETGSFYTPREIVSYMVKQSLIEYLKTKTSVDESIIEELINKHDIVDNKFDKNNLKEIESALQEIKIIDPAVGSGAFPVGILQEMTAIRVFCQSHILRKPKSSYDIKKEILENNIYGVDIDHGAIDIARLRFWLSLVVDANLFDVEPLPNLDFKLTTANTLLKLDEQQGLDDHAELLEKMKEFREKYFRARTKNGKEKIQKSFDRLIKSNFNLFASDRQKQIMTYNPFSPSSVAQFFDPEFMFGVKEFDLVIGNPPYFQLQKNKIVSEELIKQKYKTFSKSSDIYCIFYERGIKLLKNEGILIYITSNSWMKTKYGLLLRKFIKNNSSPLTLINFKSLKIFNSAVVESNILLLKKTQNKDKLQAINIAVEKNSFQDLNNYFKKNKVTIDKLNDEGWIIGNQDDMKLMLKLEKETTPLKKMDCKIYIGIINGFNSAYIINSKTRDDLINKDPNSELIIKPLLRGRDVSRYYYDWGDVWLINTHNGIRGLESRIDVKKDYPAIYEYLLRFKPELEVRKNKGSHWTNLRNCKYFNEFEKPKIIWGELSDKPKFTLDSDGFYPEATLFAMVGKNLEYILCILNSKLGLWYFQQIATSSGMGTNRWKKYKIEQIPIKELSEKDQKPFRNIIEQLLTITSATKYDSKNPPIEQKELEKEIDEMVYELYGLTEEEISIIEK